VSNITLTDEQRMAIKTFLKFLQDPNEKYMIIQGAAGCGKTTLIKHLIKAMDRQRDLYKVLLTKDPKKGDFEVMITAVTNKAAAVLRGLSEYPVSTIHSALSLKVKNNFKTGKTDLIRTHEWKLLYNKLIIVDEASMMDTQKLYKELETAACDSKIVLIGDIYQLAPVKQKQSVMDILDCTRVTLNKVMRHAGTILQTASLFRDVVESGIFQEIPTHPDVLHVDGPAFKAEVDSVFLDPNIKPNDAKMLAYTNSRVQEYNRYIRSIRGLPEAFQVGETVITNNAIIHPKGVRPVDSQVTITGIDSNTTTRYHVKGCYVELDDKIKAFMPYNFLDTKAALKMIATSAKNKGTYSWTDYFAIKEQWLDLRPTYASTVHKAQGSTYEKVFIDLSDIGRCTVASDVARMLYVAISRAQKQVILYGSLPPRYRSQATAA
jgi:energy-coupling factor transporter ATP-binding protein EcfA2